MRKSRGPRTTPRKTRVRQSPARGHRRPASAGRALTQDQLTRLEERLEELEEANPDARSEYFAALEDSSWLVAAARARNVPLARWLIHLLVRKLRNKVRLLDAEQEFLADALEKILESPAKAGQLLGLVRPKARPTKDVGELEWRIYSEVRHSMAAGIPFKDGNPTAEWDGIGAISRTAALLRVSASTIRRAYARASKLMRQIDEFVKLRSTELDKLID